MSPAATTLAAALDSMSEGAVAYALIDPALCAETLDHRDTQGVRHPLEVQGVSTPDEAASVAIPFLVALSDEASKLRSQLATFERWALEFHAVSWLASSIPVDALAAALGRRLDVVLGDELPALLRISDTRILPAVHAVLTESDRERFFALASHWWYYNREGALRVITTAANDEEAWPTPWQIAPQQESALLLAAEPDTVLALLREQAPVELSAVHRDKRHGFVVEQMELARQWGIESTQQQMLFCAIALNLGAEFSQQPTWETALAKVKSGALTLTQALALVEQGAP
ncbi:MAG: DUF4123 domain-containing protein [Rhizobacter sp.]|nr:DUF4123 domain-containing protein [Rhizobacter sp.]